MSQNVIELNGKRYDAISGKMLGPSTAKDAAFAAAAKPSSARVIDGFFRPSAAPKTAAKNTGKPARAATAVQKPAKATLKPRAATTHAAHRPAPKRPARHGQGIAASDMHTKPAVKTRPAGALPAKAKALPTAVQHHAGHAHMHTPAAAVHHHEPQHSRTLMRSAVHKPEVHMKPAIRPQAAAEIAARPASSLARKRSVAAVDPSRLERAKHTAKHTAVQKFHAISYGITPVGAAVAAAPGVVPVIPVQPQPLLTHSEAPISHADIFEKAIQRARSHQQPQAPRRRTHHRKFVNLVAGIAALLVLGGFVTYLNMPNIQLHVASLEAGFHATMPDYKPTGYALAGGVHHQGGTISMRFTSGDSSYEITQQSSNWDSQALLDNTLALSGPHKTIERAGRTIYVYGNGSSNASWVTGNVRYDITGNASLSADQLADIAASM